ncbi:MAG: OsmC family protein [Candidatus Eisenbacteria bacterium]|uniref:OsmC family protein n=1 Tax=Eiseniibacteriota bacterium TaxID=2212470 RepID=A0A538T1R9_UNCEI|nr:MAG: OsmC family protein [Candidatus Eisenbacteria bacterium]
MPARRAEAEWRGNLREGAGRLKLGSGAFEGPYSYRDRFEDGKGTNPEELLGAAHAGCFSMALAAGLTASGHPPGRIHTTATVHLEREGAGFAITKIELATEASVPGIDEAAFRTHAETAKAGCPVSKAFAGSAITLTARLLS